MRKGHFHSAEGQVEYGDADVLFPVKELDATVLTHRDAELTLADADGADVIIVAPTSLATSYALTQRALTAIRVDSLPTDVRTHLDGVLDAPIETFDLIQVGKWNRESPNHSLSEFTTA
jgi:hypothetical protein